MLKTTLMKKTILFSVAILALVACGSNDTCKDCNKPKVEKDTIVDPMAEALKKDTVAVTDTKERTENHEKIVKKFGEQWDFCNCVIANDSITDAFEKTLTPKQEEKLMNRWDYVETKCKELTTFDNTTPEERMKHEKRVNKCLKDAGLKK